MMMRLWCHEFSNLLAAGASSQKGVRRRRAWVWFRVLLMYLALLAYNLLQEPIYKPLDCAIVIIIIILWVEPYHTGRYTLLPILFEDVCWSRLRYCIKRPGNRCSSRSQYDGLIVKHMHRTFHHSGEFQASTTSRQTRSSGGHRTSDIWNSSSPRLLGLQA